MNHRIPYHYGKDIHDAWADRGRTFSEPTIYERVQAEMARRVRGPVDRRFTLGKH